MEKGLGLSSFRKHKNTIKLVCILYTKLYTLKPFEALQLICVMSRLVITDDFPSSELLTDMTGSFTL